MQPLALIFEAVVGVLAVGVAVGAPLVGMRLHRRDERPAPTLASPTERVRVRDDLPVAA